MLQTLKNEPARVVAAVIALLGVASSFGLGITDGQQAAVVALVSGVLALLGGETVRAQVVPVNKFTSTSTQPANLVDPVAAPAPAADAPGDTPAPPDATPPAA